MKNAPVSRVRIGAISLVVVIALALPGIPSEAAIKAGSICKKAQQVRVVKGVKFTCVKSGKKLVWKKNSTTNSLPIATTPLPVPTSSPSPSPSPSASPNPLALHQKPEFSRILWSRQQGVLGFPLDAENFAIPDQLPTSWDDIYEQRNGIAYKAWQSVSQTIEKSSPNIGTIRKFEGPNTIPTFTDIEGAFELVSRAFPAAREIFNTNFFVYNFRDRSWAESTFRQVYQNEDERFIRNHFNSVIENCQIEREICWAMAFIDSQQDGVVLLGVMEKGSQIELALTYDGFSRAHLGLTVAHEYFHVIQRRKIGERWFQRTGGPPSWFFEGSAVFVENAVMNHLSFDKYMRFRVADSKLAYPGCKEVGGGCFTIDSEVLERFFSLSNYEDNWGTFPYGMKYEVSSRIAEILVALKGPQSLLDVLDEMAKNQNFDVAFEKVYGISYERATPIITRILVEQYANNR